MALRAVVRSDWSTSFVHDDGDAGGSYASVYDDRACSLWFSGRAFNEGHPYRKAVCRSVYQPDLCYAGRAYRSSSCECIYFCGGKLFNQSLGDELFCDGTPGNRIAVDIGTCVDGGIDARRIDSGQIWEREFKEILKKI